MILHALEIPDAHRDRTRWLENHLTGTELACLVAELRAVHQPTQSPSLTIMLGDQLPIVMKNGLAVLDEQQVEQLLRNPDSLFELQELILLEGSDFWRTVSTDQATELATSGLEMIGQSRLPSMSAPSDATFESLQPSNQRRRAWYSHPLLVSLTTAAAVLITSDLLREESNPVKPVPYTPAPVVAQADTSWGWSRSGVIEANVTRVSYLNGLADLAEEWFDEQPETATEIAQRIGEFRSGCSKVILAKHEPLSKSDRAWLVLKCQNWATKFDSSLAAVESGTIPSEVMKEMESTVRSLTDALRLRASRSPEESTVAMA